MGNTLVAPNYSYFRTPEDNETLEGNARFEGYSIDLIQSLSEKLKFKYVIKLVPDKRYGQYNKKTKKWDGIIRQLIDGVSTSLSTRI